MKAMILAAGLGTRLAPYTDHTPKPLFSINQRPVLDLAIERLQQAGCSSIIINTHHLHPQIADHVARNAYDATVHVRHEPRILGTGGGIANIADLWQSGPLLVVNGDIVCDIDLSRVIGFHRQNQCPVTMVMHEHPDFNTVGVDDHDFVVSFDPEQPPVGNLRRLAFTGIHMLEPEVLAYLPATGFASIIDAYRGMLAQNRPIKAMVVRNHYWNDIGTPARYRSAAFDHMAPLAFASAFGQKPASPIEVRPLHGDGGDRRWYRLTCDLGQLILADHDIRNGPPPGEADAYVAIGRHLYNHGIPVPRIHLADPFCGLVFVEDVGDEHLQTTLDHLPETDRIALYRRVITHWTTMAVEGRKAFNTSWCHQTPSYDRELILEKEARYFVEAYLQLYLGRPINFDDELAAECSRLADAALDKAVIGFMHRDFQSRNIMICNDRIYFIDFQGGRLGPLQYDLASLLIDPYTALPETMQAELLAYAAATLHHRYGIDQAQFLEGYAFCAVTRNLQILGAFAFLSRAKGKTAFETYIPQAVFSLKRNLHKISAFTLPRLRSIVDQLTL